MTINSLKEKKYQIIWGIIFIFGTLLLFLNITGNSLWFDESFTAAMVHHSFFDIFSLSADDNHPPLFYLFTKLIVTLFGENTFTLRMSSLFGVLALAALGWGPVKRIFGPKASLFFSALVFLTPAFVGQAQNARMYSWAAFFLTATVLFVFLAIKEGKIKDWIVFGVAMLGGFYTHVYLTLECFIIIGLVFVWLLFNDRKKLIPFLIISGIVVLLYVPWLLVMFNQAARVAKGFWIPSPFSLDIWLDALYAPFQHEFGSTLPLWLIIFTSVVFSVLSIFGVIHAFKNRNETSPLIFLSLATSVLTFLSVFIISVLIKPILYHRYLTSLFGLYIIVWTYGILFIKKSLFKFIALALALALFVPQIIEIKTIQRNGPMADVQTYLQDKLQPGDVFVHNDEHQFGVFCYYYPHNFHYLEFPSGFNGFIDYTPFLPNGVMGHHSQSFLRGRSHLWLINRLDSWNPSISDDKVQYSSNLYKVAPAKQFLQENSFLNLSISEFSSDPGNKLKDSEVFQGNINDLQIMATGFRNNKGVAVIEFYNQDCFTLYFSSPPNTIYSYIFKNQIKNNALLSEEDKEFVEDLYQKKNNNSDYTLVRKPDQKEIARIDEITGKLIHRRVISIFDKKATFELEDFPKGRFVVIVWHDENNNSVYDRNNNGYPLEGFTSSNLVDFRKRFIFDVNSMVLDKDQIQLEFAMNYYK